MFSVAVVHADLKVWIYLQNFHFLVQTFPAPLILNKDTLKKTKSSQK